MMTLKKLERELKRLEAKLAQLEGTVGHLESAQDEGRFSIRLQEAYARKCGLAQGLPFTEWYALQISQMESDLSPFELSVLKAICDLAREGKSASIVVNADDLTGRKAVLRAIAKLREVGAIE